MSQEDSTPVGAPPAAAPGALLVEELRPPESWPGAGGRKSVAPDVPAWPGRARSHDPGGSWPGAQPAAPRRPARTATGDTAAGQLDAQALARLRSRPPAHRISRLAKGRWALVAGLGWLAPFVLVCGWIALDPTRRPTQLVALAAVAIAALAHIVVLPRLRYRLHRWEVTDDAIYVQTGSLRPVRRVVPLAHVRAVTTGQGPLERIFELGTISVNTTSGRVRLTNLPRRAMRDVGARLAERVPKA